MEYTRGNSYQIWSNIQNLDFENLLSKIPINGKIIKETSKSVSLQLDNYFIKKTKYNPFEGGFRHLFLSNRCRNIWYISNYLTNYEILTPKPIAYIEALTYSMPYQHYFISEFLYNSYNIEVFIKNEIYKEKGVSFYNFFNTLSKMILSLWEKGIYHKDLSGKNLLTINGQEIYLVDLDSTIIKKHLDIKYKIRNLIQIYDSFCDFLEEDILKNFIFSVLPELTNNELDSVYHKIQLLQKERREQHLNNLKKQTIKRVL